MRRLLYPLVTSATLGATIFAGLNSTEAFEFFRARSRPATRGCLRAYNYQQVTVSLPPARVIAVAPVDQPKVVRTPAPPEDDGQTAGNTQPVLRKKFIPKRNSISVGPVQLGQLALAIYSSGEINASGIISQNGGPTGALKGANVTIRVLALAGAPQFRGSLANAPVIAATEQALWVPRNRPERVSLVPLEKPSVNGATANDDANDDSAAENANVDDSAKKDETTKKISGAATDLDTESSDKLRSRIVERFEEITHLEIVLQYEQTE